jgi:MFS family permease
VFSALFGLGEVFQSPALQPLVNALATDRLRGRYNALFGMMFSLAFIASPALSGVLIGNGLGRWWVGGLVVGSLASAGLTWRIRGLLTDLQDGVPA